MLLVLLVVAIGFVFREGFIFFLVAITVVMVCLDVYRPTKGAGGQSMRLLAGVIVAKPLIALCFALGGAMLGAAAADNPPDAGAVAEPGAAATAATDPTADPADRVGDRRERRRPAAHVRRAARRDGHDDARRRRPPHRAQTRAGGDAARPASMKPNRRSTAKVDLGGLEGGGGAVSDQLAAGDYRLDPLDRGVIGTADPPPARRARRGRRGVAAAVGRRAGHARSRRPCSPSPRWSRYRRSPGSRSSTGCRCGPAGSAAAAGHRRWVRPLHLTTAGSPSTQPALPPWLGGLRIVAHPTDGWAAIHDQAAKTLTAHLQIAGTGFTTLAPDQMERLLSGWGAVFGVPPTKGCVASPGPTSPGRCRSSATTSGSTAQPSPSTRHRRVPGVRRRADPMRHDLIFTVTLHVGSMRGADAQQRGDRPAALGGDDRARRPRATPACVPPGRSRPARSPTCCALGLDPTGVEPAGGIRPGSLVQRLGLVPAPAAGPMRATVVAQPGRGRRGRPTARSGSSRGRRCRSRRTGSTRAGRTGPRGRHPARRSR